MRLVSSKLDIEASYLRLGNVFDDPRPRTRISRSYASDHSLLPNSNVNMQPAISTLDFNLRPNTNKSQHNQLQHLCHGAARYSSKRIARQHSPETRAFRIEEMSPRFTHHLSGRQATSRLICRYALTPHSILKLGKIWSSRFQAYFQLLELRAAILSTFSSKAAWLAAIKVGIEAATQSNEA